MTVLNETQCKKLNSILEAFGNSEYLDTEKILLIEPIERKADALINILRNRGFITRMGDSEEKLLPMMILIDSSADLFLENGGFIAEFQKEQLRAQNHSGTQINIHSTGKGSMINTGNYNTITATFNNSKGDTTSLQEELRNNSVSDVEIEEITDIVVYETPVNNSFGPKVKSWIGKMIGKSIDGTWEIGLATAGGILTEILKKFYGL